MGENHQLVSMNLLFLLKNVGGPCWALISNCVFEFVARQILIDI